MKTVRLAGIAGILLTLTSLVASAQSYTYSGAGSTQGENLAASATFTNLGGGQLGVSLANTYAGDTPDQSSVLTGVFFNYTHPASLSPVSATATAGAVMWSGATSSTPPGPSVLGTEWAYGTGSAPHSANAGIVSSGYYTPGSGNFASPGDMLDGSAYGILSAGYAGSDLDGLGTRIYIQPSIYFVLSGFDGNLADISDVSFQYGTSSSEPNILETSLLIINPTSVPEPGTMALVSLGGLTALFLRGRRPL